MVVTNTSAFSEPDQVNTGFQPLAGTSLTHKQPLSGKQSVLVSPKFTQKT